MQVEDARRYSRRIGFRTWESVKGTPCKCFFSNSPTPISCAGFTVDHSRETATASTSFSFNSSMMTRTPASSKGSYTLPSAPMRSGTSKVSARGMYGFGNGTRKLNGSMRPPSRSTRMSGWPLVVRKAVLAVLPVTMALVAWVVPWMNSSPWARSSPVLVESASAAASIAARMPSTGSWGVVGALNMWRRPLLSSSTRSVKVPPVSTANRIPRLPRSPAPDVMT